LKNNKLYYYGTNIDVRLGDKVMYKEWGLFNKEATVVYLPGQSEIHKNIGDDQWAIELNDSKELIIMPFFPHYDPYTLKKIKFIARGTTDSVHENEVIN